MNYHDGTGWTPIRYCDMCDVKPALDGEVVCGDPECQDRLDRRVDEDSE
jgi:hypothetical protein